MSGGFIIIFFIKQIDFLPHPGYFSLSHTVSTACSPIDRPRRAHPLPPLLPCRLALPAMPSSSSPSTTSPIPPPTYPADDPVHASAIDGSGAPSGHRPQASRAPHPSPWDCCRTESGWSLLPGTASLMRSVIIDSDGSDNRWRWTRRRNSKRRLWRPSLPTRGQGGGFCILVYELMHNGSLQDALLDRRCLELIDWARQFSVVLDITLGLQFLHTTCDPLIIHGQQHTPRCPAVCQECQLQDISESHHS